MSGTWVFAIDDQSLSQVNNTKLSTDYFSEVGRLIGLLEKYTIHNHHATKNKMVFRDKN